MLYPHVRARRCFGCITRLLADITVVFSLLSFPVDSGEAPGTPIITITEDHSVPLDDDDYVKYFGLESHTQQGSCLPHIVVNVIHVASVCCV